MGRFQTIMKMDSSVSDLQHLINFSTLRTSVHVTVHNKFGSGRERPRKPPNRASDKKEQQQKTKHDTTEESDGDQQEEGWLRCALMNGSS